MAVTEYTTQSTVSLNGYSDYNSALPFFFFYFFNANIYILLCLEHNRESLTLLKIYGGIKMISTRYIAIILCILLLISGIHISKDLFSILFALTSIFLLLVYRRIAYEIGFTKSVINAALDNIDIDGKEHIFDLQGFNSSRTQIILSRIIFANAILMIAVAFLNVYFINIEMLTTYALGIIIPPYGLWIYLLVVANNIGQIEIGTTTIKIIR